MNFCRSSKFFFVWIFVLSTFSCQTNFVNPNAPTDVQILSTRNGLLNLSVGVLQLYATQGLRWVIETPAVTTREVGITTTFQNMIELEDGGQKLPNTNTNVSGLWATMLRIIRMCDDLLANAEKVPMEAGTRVGIMAHARLFKAMAIGALAQHYEQVVVSPATKNAEFVHRTDAYKIAAALLKKSEADLLSQKISKAFDQAVLQENIDLLNTTRTYLARYQLFAGNYQAAIEAAGSVNLSSVSNFRYDELNPNPIWGRVVKNNISSFKPRDNFGLPKSLAPDPNDGRIAFYLKPLEAKNQNNLPIEDLRGFFTTDVQPIPVYLPTEIDLILAEAELRKANPDFKQARNALNAVLTQTNDRYGLNARLPAYSGPETVEAMLTEIYKNRRIALFLTGMSLEDSRRFNRQAPGGEAGKFTEERNRNFYPYPQRERSNNSNTPPDPQI